MNLMAGTRPSAGEGGPRIAGYRPFLLCALVIWLFFAWIIANTPYGLDDWVWGTSTGMEDFLTGSQNGRYVGNLFEIIVTRSAFLKVVLIATMATLLPLLSVCLIHRMVSRDHSVQGGQKLLIGLLLSAVLMYLTVPREVWRQTFGWIAGFSNFGFSGVLLLLYQKQLFDAQKPGRSCPARSLIAAALTACCASLILENVTVYVLAVSLLSALFYVIRNRRCNALHLALLLGSFAGTFLMFSGSIYGTLFSTGRAWNDMRSLTVDLDAGLWNNFRILYMRFVYFFPHQIWGDQWIPCTLSAALLAVKCARSRRRILQLGAVPFAFFAVYFVAVRLLGPIENHIARWSDVLTQRLNLLFFWLVLFSILLLWRENRSGQSLLLFLWLSVPGIILPLLVTNTTGDSARCLLTPTVLLIEFCLALIADAESVRSSFLKKGLSAILVLLLLFSAGELLKASYGNGQLMRERAALVRSAREGETDSLVFPDFPNPEYLWVTEPLGDRQIRFFRQFYRIPENVKMSFNTGNLEDYDFYAHIRSQ